MKAPEKGDLIFIDFNPQSGHEQSGYRPAIVLSPIKFNEATGFAVICPITRQAKGYPFEVKISEGLEVDGVILTDQQKNLDWKSRNLKVIDKAPASLIDTCIQRIETYLYR